jgi:hypothetical protein
MYIGLHVKYLLILSHFKRNFNLLETSEKFSVSAFTKIHPERAEFLHADGQTGMTKLTVAFRNFANAPTTIHCFGNWICFWPVLRGGRGGGVY